jgi:cation-transporting ATPase I
VRPIVLTGDHPQTARAVARELGWPEQAVVVTGDELTARDRGGRAELLRDCDVIARVAPEQKLQVVEALRQAGHVVAMVGDGSNDAAAIRAADIGVALAAHGSAAARNAADLVLVGDGLTGLVPALAEGRALWRSVADATAVLVGGNAGEIGFSVLATLVSGTAPLTARQMLLVNLFTDLLPATALAVTPRADGAEAGPGGGSVAGDRPTSLADLGAPLLRQIGRRGAVTCVGAGTAWALGALTPGTARRTSTMALCGVVGAQLLQTVHGRGHSPLVVATALGSAAALVLLVETPGVSHALGCTPLGPVAWLGVAASLLAAQGAAAF